MAAFATSLGYSVAYEPTPRGAAGWCDHKRRRIVVNADAPLNAQLRIVIHETAHALGIDYRTYTREQAEVMVDTLAFTVCRLLGLDTAGNSIAYLAVWSEHAPADAFERIAALVDRLARRLEDALQPDSGERAAEAAINATT